ncbi:hypothetical protein CAS74_003358 [Pichia kudriavzevii]|uniref:Vacuolar protein sorting-associated protein 75 n=1 Tax=Pichia kudriavzevii TaxID=4909 RepID=A0A099NZW7_PICKU|nr:uncharacterized protein C5L36_0B02580 [Pichia kudriavzevii]AWU74999.1 hypothetical protein C5L36_0B02580 [Pichia kudriavzevii]KGK38210.1 hypothetical protein JL09_g2681 [Pichia kudriavzevii]ONH74958.1 Vacuolar protein sorting-associated protein 75 [Pichia kudriavzevii]OUT21243.1 hypothetical protein CAS74_003358 [Pichia kudriavzevii]
MVKPEVSVDKDVEESMLALKNLEVVIQEAEAQVEKFKNNLFKPIYDKRREYIKKIPKFWYVVLVENEDFQEYVRVEDMKYIESISDIYVEYWDKTPTTQKINIPKKGFRITVQFDSSHATDYKIKSQTITKDFEWILDQEDGVRKLISTAAEIEWPQELQSINPQIIKQFAKDEGRSLTADEKKRYRQGMRSFFAFWGWTGRKAGKEFRSGEELATLIADTIFPIALDFYTMASVNDVQDGDSEDQISGEELDLSETEDPSEPMYKKQKI